MASLKIQDGEAITFITSEDVTAGVVTLLSGGLFVSPHRDAVAGDEVVGEAVGVYAVPSDALTWTPGQAVYFNASTKRATQTAGSNTRMGVCWNGESTVVAAGDPVLVKINV